MTERRISNYRSHQLRGLADFADDTVLRDVLLREYFYALVKSYAAEIFSEWFYFASKYSDNALGIRRGSRQRGLHRKHRGDRSEAKPEVARPLPRVDARGKGNAHLTSVNAYATELCGEWLYLKIKTGVQRVRDAQGLAQRAAAQRSPEQPGDATRRNAQIFLTSVVCHLTSVTDGSSDREVLTYTYDSGGLVASAAGKKAKFNYTYLAELDYDKFGQRVSMTLGNGVTTTYTYNAQNRRLANLQSELPTPSSYQFQNLNYTYDAVGNITALANAIEAASGGPGNGNGNGNGNGKSNGNGNGKGPSTGSTGSPQAGSGTGDIGGPTTQTFTYDDLYRLTAAAGSYVNAAGATNTYALAMVYNSIHNIVSKAQTNNILSTNGKTSAVSSLTYTLANVYESGKPHAASANGEYTLRYDANGNLIKRDAVENGHSRQLIWDEENRLACTRDNHGSTALTNQQGYLPQTPDSCQGQGNSNAPIFTYDAAGVRVAKNSGALSLTINQNYSENQNSAYKHIFIGTQRLTTKLVGNNTKKLEDSQWYYSGDHLSSTSYVTDADGEIVEHLQYFPYGETWVQEKSSLPIAYQFTAKELDQETGYYYFGARYYDPRVSTWVSPDDRFTNVYRSTALNIYSYVSNRPTIYIDPDGHDDSFFAEQYLNSTLNNLPDNWNMATRDSRTTLTFVGKAELAAVIGGYAFYGVAMEFNFWGLVSNNRVFHDARTYKGYGLSEGIKASVGLEITAYPGTSLKQLNEESYSSMGVDTEFKLNRWLGLGFGYSRNSANNVTGYSVSVGAGIPGVSFNPGDNSASSLSGQNSFTGPSASLAPMHATPSGGPENRQKMGGQNSRTSTNGNSSATRWGLGVIPYSSDK